MIEWINCKDRLPSINEEVIFRATTSYINVGCLTKDLHWESNSKDIQGNQKVYTANEVTHWSEINLPEDKVKACEEKELDITEITSLSLSFYAMRILKDSVEQGYARRPVVSDFRVDYVDIVDRLLASGLIQVVEPTEDMLKYNRFSSEESKQSFINEFMFCVPTSLGKLLVALMKERSEALRILNEKLTNEMKSLKFDIASNILKSCGFDLNEIISENCDDRLE